MQSEAPLTLILSPLRAGRGELERTSLGSLFGDPDALPRKVPLSLSERERVRVRVRLYCLDTAKRSRVVVGPFANAPAFWSAAGSEAPRRFGFSGTSNSGGCRFTTVGAIQSAVAAALCRRTPKVPRVACPSD